MATTLTNKVTNESAVEVGNPLHATGHVNGTWNFSRGLFLIVVVTQHETQEQAGHDDVTDAQHGEVTAGWAGEHQFAGKGETGDVPSHAGSQVQFAGENVEGVVGGLRGHLHHHVTVEDVGGEEDLRGMSQRWARDVELE